MKLTALLFTLSISYLTLPLIAFAEAPISPTASALTAVTLQKQKIGVIVPLSGAFARYGEKITAGLLSGGLAKEELIFEDEGCDPTKAVSAYKKLSEVDKVGLFLGPWCGSPQSAVAPLLSSQKKIAILGSSAPQEAFSKSGGRMFSTQHTIEQESTFLAHQVNARGAKRIATVFFENQFSRAHEAAFRKAYSGEIVETFAYTSQSVSELKSIALKLKGLKLDALYVPDAFPLLQGFLKELKALSINLPIYSVYSAQSPDVLASVTAANANLILSYPKIGEQEALEVFPREAARIMKQVAGKCGDDDACLLSHLNSDYAFDEHGVLKGELILKTVVKNAFVPVG